MRIYISGLYSGPNPSPGVGVARSIRAGFPDATIVGVDYSQRSTGLHWPDFDEVWLQRPWNELDLEVYAAQIRSLIDGGAYWISGLDLEVRWLARTLPGARGVLSPPEDALRRVAKTSVTTATTPGFQLPERLLLRGSSQQEQYRFCRRHGWHVWLKGPYYEAHRVRSWEEFQARSASVAEMWSSDEGFLEAHVSGREESIALAAVTGELLNAVHLVKMETTPEGKTWAGRVEVVASDVLVQLRSIIKDLNWTGGAEIEYIKDADGRPWLLEWNPRFPAWIFGAHLAGHNLPGLLVSGATGAPLEHAATAATEFVRVVLELPRRAGFPLHVPPESWEGPTGGSKHPSGMPLLAQRLMTAKSSRASDIPIPVHGLEQHDLAGLAVDQLSTPMSIFLPSVADAGFGTQHDLMHRVSSEQFVVAVAYSIKTNPDPRLLALASRHGLWAEAISGCEVDAALRAGIPQEHVVFNGPSKEWASTAARVGTLFCDSVEELHALVSRCNKLPATVGVRLRPVNAVSRFGVSTEEVGAIHELVRLVRQLPEETALGVHWHMASSVAGTSWWWRSHEAMLEWCLALQDGTGRPVQCLDLGGGWQVEDWRDELCPRLERAVQTTREQLPALRVMLLEPGKALAEPSMMLAVRVLEVRAKNGHVGEVVIDGSIAELPQAHVYPHRVLRAIDGSWMALPPGEGRILGRLCMENDILGQRIALPRDIATGEVLLIADTGAYDASMSYTFGRG